MGRNDEKDGKDNSSMNIKLSHSVKAQAFLAKNPTLIGIVSSVPFYEHPTLGDETTLFAITPNGKLVKSPWYDLPTVKETKDWKKELEG